MTEALYDQPARDRFQTEFGTNFCVSAGAGVGKTTSIVRRVAALARSNPDALGRLVVVTYANAAADELRLRSRELLLEEKSGDLLPKFRQAFFGTIHSFCLKLVNEFGVELGVAPDAKLLENEDEDEVWARYCESPALDAVTLDADLLDEVTRFLSFDELLKLARKIDAAQAERLLARYAPERRPPLNFTAALADGGGRSRDATVENQETLKRFIEDFESGAGYLRIPSFSNGSGTFKEAYRLGILPLATWLDMQSAALAARIALGYRDYRRDQRLMTYADQVAWCRRLVGTPAVLEELRARNWIVLLDEAQDTDAAMFTILSEVARPPGAAVGTWPGEPDAATPRPGQFCFVGDEQQSIYASRANLGVYRKYIDAFAAGNGGERLEYSVTMRCPRRVIEVVNAIFVHGNRLPQQHFSFRELHPKPDCAEGAAWVLPIEPLAGDKAKVEDLFAYECRQVAAFLKEVGTRGLGVEKWNDVAILCPRRRWLRVAADTFIEAGLHTRLISQQRLRLELPEHSWPAALVHVLLNPWDRFELIGVLREIFAVSDVELGDAQADNEPFTFWSERGLSKRLASSLALLRELHAETPPGSGLSIGQYFDCVLEKTCLAERLTAAGQSNAALPRLRREAIRAEVAGTSLRAWAAALVRSLARPAAEVGGGDGEIQLLTCQKAKGLEWPVVIPLGLGRSIPRNKQEYPSIEENVEEITVHVSNVTVDDEEKEVREKARLDELLRVFYVTLTRAKSLLILPDSLPLYRKSKDSFLELCKWGELDRGELFSTQRDTVSLP